MFPYLSEIRVGESWLVEVYDYDPFDAFPDRNSIEEITHYLNEEELKCVELGNRCVMAVREHREAIRERKARRAT